MQSWRMIGLILMVVLPVARGENDEPSELNWERFGNDPHVFQDFRRYWEQQKLPGGQDQSCPRSFPAISINPEAFADNPGRWKISAQGGTEVLQANYGHNTIIARAALHVEEPGAYRVWVKYYKLKGYFASFALRILTPEMWPQTNTMVVSSKGEYYAHRFDWKEHSPKRPEPLPVHDELTTGFHWESGPLVELGPGDYTLELSTLVHGAPYTFRRIAQIVLTADPLLENPEAIVGQNSFAASDPTRQHWSAWSQRPGAVPWESLKLQQQQYYLDWRASFLRKLAQAPETIAEKRMAAQVYFDEQVNLIGTPAEVAAEKQRLVEMSRIDFWCSFIHEIEAEKMDVGSGWEAKEMTDASGSMVLQASYADGLASADARVTLPQAGRYYVWVRHFLFHKYFSIFDLFFVDQQGAQLARLPYGQPDDRFQARNNHFFWECLPVELPAGELTLSLRKNVGKGPYTYRRIDKILITDNQSVHPDTFRRVASPHPTTVWQQSDPWGGFSRISAPRAEDIVEPETIQLDIVQHDTATALLHYRNDTTAPIVLEPHADGQGAPNIRLVAYMNTALYGWTPVVLLERQKMTVPAQQNVSIWLTFSTSQLPLGSYTPHLQLGERRIAFEVNVNAAEQQKPVPLVGGWCRPLARESCWELFRDIGINLIFRAAITKAEMQQYGIKHLSLSLQSYQADAIRASLASLQELGLSVADWSVFLLDEPTEGSIDRWLELAQSVRMAAPDVQIWCNPGEIQSSTAEVVRKARPYIDVFCPYINHFTADDEKYAKEELPAIGKIKLLYTTPCFREKSSDSPRELLHLGAMASKYKRDGWAPFSLFCSYPYSNSIWDEVYPFNACQAISFYPGAYGRTLSTRNLEAMREAIQRYRKSARSKVASGLK